MNCTRVYKNYNLTMTVLLTICLFLYCKNLKKTKDWVWGIMTRTIKLMKFSTRSKIEGWQCNWWAASSCITKISRKPRMISGEWRQEPWNQWKSVSNIICICILLLFVKVFKPGAHQLPDFLKLILCKSSVCVCMCVCLHVCVCVPTPEAINN